MGNTSSVSMLEHEVRSVTEHLAALLYGLEPLDVPLPEAPGVLDAFVELERRAAAGRLLVSARAVESIRWKREGFASPAEWLADKSGTSTGRARDDLKTSERLDGLDDTAAAVRDGQLSPDQARAIAEAAAANPAAERDLLDQAKRDSLRGLQDEAARRKAEVEDVEARERRIRRDRRCRTWTDRDGSWNLAARGALSDGAALMVELERLTNQAFHRARRSGEPEGRDAYAFDGLMDMATRSHARFAPIAVPDAAAMPDAAGPAPDAEPDPPKLCLADDMAMADVPPAIRADPPARENLRRLALLHVDLAALIRGEASAGERCEIPGVGPVSIATARELLGDAILKLVITNGVDVLNVTHLGRGPNMAQQVALLWAQPQCCVEGCNRRARLQVDHRRPFATDRVTELWNLDRLCEHHHERKTRGGWSLVAGAGRRPMVPPEDARHPDRTANHERAGPGRRRSNPPKAPPDAA